MSINLEKKITYPVHVGSSLQRKKGTGSTTTNSSSSVEDLGFHLVSRQLPRTTTRLSRDTLENGENMRVRFPSGVSKHSDDKQPILLEATARNEETTCTYEGDYVRISRRNSDGSRDADDGTLEDSDDEVECVLVYDAEIEAFTIHRLESRVSVTSGGLSSVVPGTAGTNAGALVLPTKKHNSTKHNSGKASSHSSSKRESKAMDDELEDALAKELDDILSDDSDGGTNGKTSRKNSMRQQHQDQLLDEIVESHSEDEFEEVDSSQVLSARQNVNQSSVEMDVESLSDHHSGAEDNEMIFEEVDPSMDLGVVSDSSLHNSRVSGSPIEDDSDQFEDVSASRIISLTGKDAADDDALFGGSFSASPLSFTDQGQDIQGQGQRSHSGDHGTDTQDEFEDLDLDLVRSLDSS
ncbi:hypothetical protein COEREDRAFT_80035 [Coemansia reversa NRRL 1564]|uniref:Uncharacterized protein n=1 Tax=Coemansia reversa (strain ATCC 12441 / NRRL 1564) TaxID=763665 RepID=A0A2G5BGG3_COERN|nr:hypothetical protein COEREDRAFT_80035 [Coemansia reversa NRRL 1564]|eukprot:PIA18091.1 hypothetical protein COEREDRAFT_80035 [Coemansia reversa NRRL 1564]